MSNQVIKRGIFLDPMNDTNVNYDYLSKNVDFAILKTGNTKNTTYIKKFAAAYDACKSNNIPVGVYYDLELVKDNVKTKAQIQTNVANIAKYLINNYLSGRKFSYPIYVGLTNNDYFPKVSSTTSVYLPYVDIVSEFNKQLVLNNKYWIGFFVNADHLNYIKKNSLQIKQDYSMWVTNCGIGKNYNEDYMNDHIGMWEYTTTDRVIGLKKDCCMSYCFEDYPGLISSNRKNGF